MVRIVFFPLFWMLFSVSAFAQTDLTSTIDLVSKAYGGGKLSSLKSISIQSNRRLAYPGTNFSPDFNEFVEDRYHFQIDLIGQRGSTERYVKQSGNIYHDRIVTTQDGLAQISYPLNRVIYETDHEFYNRYGIVFRISDTLLAYVLVKHPERAEVKTPTTYRGHHYRQIAMTLPGSDAPLLLSVDAETGLIMQMTRQYGTRQIVYLYRQHTKERGISYARENQVYLNGELFDYEMGRRVKINRVSNATFKVSGDLNIYTPPDSNEIKVKKITKDIYHAGSGIQHSTFILSNGIVIATGGNDGFKDRYEAFRKQQPTAGPLRYLILTHDHEINRNGYKDALDLGATLVVSKKILNHAKATLGPVEANRIRSVIHGETLGPIVFYEFSTKHTLSMMVSYLPADKILLEEDHYRPVFDGVPEHLFETSISFVKNVDSLGLEVETLLSAHGAKAESWSVLQKVVAGQAEYTCSQKRKICRGD